MQNVPYDGTLADVWSAGVVLYAMFAGVLPFDDDSNAAVFAKIKRGEYDSTHPDVPPVARDLIARCLVVDPSERYTVIRGVLCSASPARDPPRAYELIRLAVSRRSRTSPVTRSSARTLTRPAFSASQRCIRLRRLARRHPLQTTYSTRPSSRVSSWC